MHKRHARSSFPGEVEVEKPSKEVSLQCGGSDFTREVATPILRPDLLKGFEEEDGPSQQQVVQQQALPCSQTPGQAEPAPGIVRGPNLPRRVSQTPAAAAGAATTSAPRPSPLQQRPLPQLPARSKKQQKGVEQQPVLRPEA